MAGTLPISSRSRWRPLPANASSWTPSRRTPGRGTNTWGLFCSAVLVFSILGPPSWRASSTTPYSPRPPSSILLLYLASVATLIMFDIYRYFLTGAAPSRPQRCRSYHARGHGRPASRARQSRDGPARRCWFNFKLGPWCWRPPPPARGRRRRRRARSHGAASGFQSESFLPSARSLGAAPIRGTCWGEQGVQ